MLFYANFLLVTLNEDATTLHVRKAIELLRGVVSTTVPWPNFNEKCARIKKTFTSMMGSDMAEHYYNILCKKKTRYIIIALLTNETSWVNSINRLS